MSNTILAWNNYVLTSALSANSEATNMSVGNVKDERGSKSTTQAILTSS
jgi:hypothetical protein